MQYVGLLDCNNFFVSCERLFRPDLVGKPVAVLSSNDGCIVARSQEVKDMGIPMGLPLFQAKQLTDMSSVTLFSSNFPLYRDISSRVMQCLAEEVGECEVYSIDEAFFKVSSTITDTELQRVRQVIMQKTGIPVSIGVAATKTLAKVGSKLAKKQGGTKILETADWRKVAETFALEDIWNLGRATVRTLREHSVTTPAAFMALDPAWVRSQFGVMGCRLQDELKGTAVYTVATNSNVLRQSLASTRSFAKTTNDEGSLKSALTYHLTHVAEKLRTQKIAASWLVVELRAGRHSDFAYRRGTVLVPLVAPSNSTVTLLATVMDGFGELFERGVPYKKAGVVAGGLVPVSFIQPDLFAATAPTTAVANAWSAVDAVTDSLNRRFGGGTIRPGSILDRRPKTNASLRSPSYTTVWKDIPTVRAV